MYLRMSNCNYCLLHRGHWPENCKELKELKLIDINDLINKCQINTMK